MIFINIAIIEKLRQITRLINMKNIIVEISLKTYNFCLYWCKLLLTVYY